MKLNIAAIKDEKDKQFVRMVHINKEKSENQYRPIFTDFYNSEWLHSKLRQYFPYLTENDYSVWGGYEGAERQVLGFCPYPIMEEDLEIAAIKLEVKTGIGKPLTHRDYLGAILGLGIDRRQIGDIILKPFGAYIILQERMIDYLIGHMQSIGRYQKIEITRIPFTALEVEKPVTQLITTTVASLRADVVAASCFNVSRTECAKLIQAEKLKCNGVLVTVNKSINEGDSLTLRGYGRAKLISVDGLTKKQRFHITIEKYK